MKHLWTFLFLQSSIISAFALIKGPPEVSNDYLDRYVVKEGDTLKLNCPINGLPRPIIEWYQDEHLITSTWDRFRFNRRYLKIKSVLSGDSGVYVCKGVNGFGSKSVQINVIVKGRKEASYGLPEEASEPDKNEVLLLSGSSGYLRENGKLGNNVVVNNNPLLDLRTQSPPVLSSSPLDGGVPPRWIQATSYHPGYGLHFQTGELLKLECLVEGIPSPTIVWFKDGDILITPNLQDDRSQTTLLIPNLQMDDSGLYKCKARNVWGEVNSTFPVKVHDKVEPPHMLDEPGSSNVTVKYGSSIVFSCQVQSLGPTQIQWLKQLHKQQEPKNKNKTIVVFDYVFEILQPQSKTSSSGGYYNSTLLVQSEHPYATGRYICLVNNQVGHTHKEIFLHIEPPLSESEKRIRDPNWSMRAEDSNSFPLSLVILVPILSVIILFLLFISVFILRKHTRSQESSSSSSPSSSSTSSGGGPSSALMNSRQVLLSSQFVSGQKGDSEWISSSGSMWKKSGSSGGDSSSCSEKWVEVTNKANQTPVHWAYGDVLLHAATPDLLYPSEGPPSSLGRSSSGHPEGGGYSIPKSEKGNASSSSLLRSNGLVSSRFLHLRDVSYPEYYAVVTAGSTELYARPPSDHFYFKISDGKTEFI